MEGIAVIFFIAGLFSNGIEAIGFFVVSGLFTIAAAIYNLKN